MGEVDVGEHAAVMREARRVVVLTGAGVSAESGVPTFRDAQTGLWEHYDPQELATPEAYARNPALVWDWYQWRRELVSAAKPNAGHRALAVWERQVPGLLVVTQNVDGLHQAAGSANVIELHGNIHRNLCIEERKPVEAAPGDEGHPPHCPDCGSPLRPDVVWFGEMLPEQALRQAFISVCEADLVLSVGTSSLVQPAASLPYEALRAGVPVFEVNPRETPLTPHCTASWRGCAGDVLPALVKAAFPEA